jgi:hypothetical protein
MDGNNQGLRQQGTSQQDYLNKLNQQQSNRLAIEKLKALAQKKGLNGLPDSSWTYTDSSWTYTDSSWTYTDTSGNLSRPSLGSVNPAYVINPAIINGMVYSAYQPYEVVSRGTSTGIVGGEAVSIATLKKIDKIFDKLKSQVEKQLVAEGKI